MDPCLKEELAASGSFTVTQNPHGELCAVQKAHGVGLAPDQLLHCIRVAGAKVGQLLLLARVVACMRPGCHS